MEYLSTSISPVLAARHQTTPSRGGSGEDAIERNACPGWEKGEEGSNALEITNPRMDTRKPRLYSSCQFLFAFIPIFSRL